VLHAWKNRNKCRNQNNQFVSFPCVKSRRRKIISNFFFCSFPAGKCEGVRNFLTFSQQFPSSCYCCCCCNIFHCGVKAAPNVQARVENLMKFLLISPPFFVVFNFHCVLKQKKKAKILNSHEDYSQKTSKQLKIKWENCVFYILFRQVVLQFHHRNQLQLVKFIKYWIFFHFFTGSFKVS
jgi:hypothetical protein